MTSSMNNGPGTTPSRASLQADLLAAQQRALRLHTRHMFAVPAGEPTIAVRRGAVARSRRQRPLPAAVPRMPWSAVADETGARVGPAGNRGRGRGCRRERVTGPCLVSPGEETRGRRPLVDRIRQRSTAGIKIDPGPCVNVGRRPEAGRHPPCDSREPCGLPRAPRSPTFLHGPLSGPRDVGHAHVETVVRHPAGQPLNGPPDRGADVDDVAFSLLPSLCRLGARHPRSTSLPVPSPDLLVTTLSQGPQKGTRVLR
jgi:hypothetical protein